MKRHISIFFILAITSASAAQPFDMEISEKANGITRLAGENIAKITFVTDKTYSLTVHHRDGSLSESVLSEIDRITFNRATGVTEWGLAREIGPKTFVLHRNYPNPFNPSTTIEYELPSSGWIEIQVYNVRGQLIRNLESRTLPSGSYRVVWNGEDDFQQIVTSGVYLFRMEFNGSVQMLKLLFVK